jgi:hypothetical protein
MLGEVAIAPHALHKPPNSTMGKKRIDMTA